MEKVGLSVVNISTSRSAVANPFRGRSPLSDFFGRATPQPAERESLGSGVIIRPEGYILTNNHVIDGATEIRVSLADDRAFPAEVVGTDPSLDLAVIKVNAKSPLPAAPIGKSSDLMIGETIIAIGNPFGLTHTVTTGVLSATGRSIQGENDRLYHDFLQIDASINPGNSGGALVNINGELIGITTAVFRPAEGIGFAVPIDKAKAIINDLINYGKVTRPFFGFYVRDISSDLRARLGWREKGGALVTKVFAGGPAATAGLAPGDIISTMNGKKITDKDDLYSRLSSWTEGGKLSFTVFRSPKLLEISIRGTKMTGPLAEKIGYEWLGIQLTPVDARTATRLKLPTAKGLLITKLDNARLLARTGVKAGDVLRRINLTQTNTMADYRSAIIDSQAMGGAVVYIQRDQFVYQITVGD
ncbi:MAG: trypsin-like peptidase domain-containing protein [Nitrospinae bacterium]|nr:trypsin-like peptidase domain-containing protein [Nitrospinota bacterium]